MKSMRWSGCLVLFGAICTPAMAQDDPRLVDVPEERVSPEQAQKLQADLAALGVTMRQADTLENEGKIQQAEPFWRDALHQREQLLGKTSPLLVNGKSRLARNLEMQGRYQDAEALRRSSVDLLKATPQDWEAMAKAQSALGYNLMMQSQLSEAAEQSYAALELWRKANKAEDIEATQALSTVGLVLNRLGQSAEAEPFYVRALTIRRKVLGENDIDTATSYNNLASVLSTQGKFAEADGYFRKAYDIREKNGTVPALLAQNAFNIGINLNQFKPKDNREAEPYFRRSIELWTQVFGPDNIQTAAGYNGLGMDYYRHGQFEEAKENFQRALKIREKELGTYHPDVAETYSNLGLVERALGHEKRAQKLLTKALDISTRSVGADHPSTQAIQEAITSPKST